MIIDESVFESIVEDCVRKKDWSMERHAPSLQYGGAIQSISKEADSLTRVEFYFLMEQVFALPAVQKLVDTAVQNHKAGGDC